MSVEIKDNREIVFENMSEALLRGLEKIGLVAEGYAKKLCPVDTGNLRNSITHKVVLDAAVSGDITVQNGRMDVRGDGSGAVYIGTNSEYAPYVELGTGIYAKGGGGRPTPWTYQDAKGNWHMTHGNKSQPFLKPAAHDHRDQYRQILEDELKNG